MSLRNVAFVLACWTITRVAVALAFAHSAPDHIADALGNWDGAWYGSIVRHGYEFVADGGRHNVAFFPMFPLVSKAVYSVGIAWPLAGAIVNNAAFFAALFVIFIYARERLNESSARWVVAVACFLPLSLFGSVAYSEGLFVLTSSLALLAYQRERFVYAGVAGVAATLTRPFGMALVAGLVIAAIVERRRPLEILACAIGLVGAALFPFFCWWQYGDPLAFVHAQSGWRPGAFDLSKWFGLLRGATGNWHDRLILLLLVCVAGSVICFRRQIGTAGMWYTGMTAALIALSGSPISIDRFLWALVPVLVALALAISRRPLVGYIVLALLGWLLVVQASTFAQGRWVA